MILLGQKLNTAYFQVQNLLKKGEEDSTTNVTVSVIFYFTTEFQAVTPDIEGHIGGLIENTNVAFLRSEIPVQLAIHCIVKSRVGEASESADRIREFKQSRGEHFYFYLLGAYVLRAY